MPLQCFGPRSLNEPETEALLLSEAIAMGTERHGDAFIWLNNRRRARTRAGDLKGALEDAYAVLQNAPDSERGEKHAAEARESLLQLEGHPTDKFADPVRKTPFVSHSVIRKADYLPRQARDPNMGKVEKRGVFCRICAGG
jgi:hypothetical protein